MRNGLLSLGFAAGFLFLAAPDLDACGDKLIRMGRAFRISRAAHPASILIYNRPGSGVPAAAQDLKLSRTLGNAGHLIRTVEHESDLRLALNSGTYDIIVSDPDAAAIVERVQTGTSKPRFLPVFYKPSKQQLAAAEQQNLCFLASPGKAHEVLAEIDHVMAQRRKAARTGL